MKYHIVVLLSALFLSISASSFAQQAIPSPTVVIEEGQTVNNTGTTSAKPQKIDYELAYPGMLPDNPLYFTKMLRDKIVKWLISDPLKKAQFSLLNAEKRMYAGRLLVEKGKDKLALETISKSNNYLHEALSAISEVRKKEPQNPDIMPFLEKIKTVALKHQEVFENITLQFDKSLDAAVIKEKQRLSEILKSIEKMKQPAK